MKSKIETEVEKKNKSSLDSFSSYLGHDVSFAAQILVTQAEKAVDDERLEAISYRVKVDVVVVIVEEENAEPRIECVDWHNEQDSNYPLLLIFHIIVLQVQIDL